ncbi:adenosine deaminase [Phragmitibacter flavus]|uniref:adenosine deaminase n=1 Tax=Phragmitibacter flavus TaxID=2576071 RepID=A0A5R8KAY0_9BACT|nr:adenosine deaminase [Phragmitibacter flavus]TLD69417.1 adenosine deaminase [Phragmitibacter flavus]
MQDLHIHLGGAVPSSVLWETLCDNGLQTEFVDFATFHDSLTARPDEVKSLDDFLGRYFQVTEEIQSSPSAANVSAYQVVAKAYRRAKVTSLELRFNPHKRMRHGLHTMDAIILAVIQGLERASLHYGVATGIILSLGRDLPLDANWQIIEAAIKWRSRGPLNGASGVVGIDMAGPESRALELDPDWLSETTTMMHQARAAGLKITYHIGESPSSGPQGMLRVLENIQPDRIGHGIELRHATGTTKASLVHLLRQNSVCLELCPTVNIVTRVIPDITHIAQFVRELAASDIPFCINTDNPYLIHTNLKREHEIIGAELGNESTALLALSAQHASRHHFLSE